MSTLSVRLPDPLDHDLAREAEEQGKNRSELAREAIAEYVERRARDRFLATLAAEARSLHGSGEAVEVAEELLAAENEALEVAEEGATEPAERWWV